jgi:hypothetical protein
MKNIVKRLSWREIKKQLINIALINERMKEIEDLRYSVSRLDFMLGGHLQGKEYWLKDSIGFNSQLKRKATFKAINEVYDFDAIIETGTNIGATTGYLASLTGKQVHSCEIRPESFSLAKDLLYPYFENIKLYNTDSIEFLNANLSSLSNGKLFIYLDAHWYDFLPLREEIEIISNQCREFLILIDDFQVMGDNGYGYDKYANGKELTLKYILDLISRFNLSAYFPSAPSGEETGAKRGYIYLAKGQTLEAKLSQIELLRRVSL